MGFHTEGFFFDYNHCQPPRAFTVSCLRHESDSGQISQRTLIKFKNFPLSRYPCLEALELATSQGRKDVAHTVVVAYRGVFIMRRGVPCLLRKEPGFLDNFPVV
jgi:hypothetical protein